VVLSVIAEETEFVPDEYKPFVTVAALPLTDMLHVPVAPVPFGCGGVYPRAVVTCAPVMPVRYPLSFVNVLTFVGCVYENTPVDELYESDPVALTAERARAFVKYRLVLPSVMPSLFGVV
jgi:hypothetical protein